MLKGKASTLSKRSPWLGFLQKILELEDSLVAVREASVQESDGR